MTKKKKRCERTNIRDNEYWWGCLHCKQTWNERFVGPHWRPKGCPDRKGKEARMGNESYRHQENHNGG